MPVLKEIAFYRGRREIVPHQKPTRWLADARPLDALLFADAILIAVRAEVRAGFIEMLDKRIPVASSGRLSRLKRVFLPAEEIS